MACVIVLDASVLIAVLDDTDAHHRDAVTLLLHTADEDLGANVLTLAEVLVRPARLGRLDEVRAALVDLDVQELPFPSAAAVELARIRATTALRMPDCCVLLSAHHTGGKVASFDDRLVMAARGRGLATAGH